MNDRFEIVNSVLERNDALSCVRDIIVGMQDTYLGIVMDRCDITEDSLLSDLGMDSLDEVELIIAIENRLMIHIPEDYEVHSVRDAVDIILKLKNNTY